MSELKGLFACFYWFYFDPFAAFVVDIRICIPVQRRSVCVKYCHYSTSF